MWQSGRRQKLKSLISASRTAWSLAALIGFGLTAAAAFYGGYDYGLRRIGASADEVRQLRVSGQQQQQALAQLKAELATLRQDRDIAVQTAEKLQAESRNQLASVADMQEQIVLYQRLLGARGAPAGLSIENLSIRQTADHQYQYRLLLTQVANNQTDISGKASLRVLGLARNQAVSLPPADFQFQYFKSVGGAFTLPAGFQADSVEITLQATGRKAARIQKKFKWEVASQ